MVEEIEEEDEDEGAESAGAVVPGWAVVVDEAAKDDVDELRPAEDAPCPAAMLVDGREVVSVDMASSWVEREPVALGEMSADDEEAGGGRG